LDSIKEDIKKLVIAAPEDSILLTKDLDFEIGKKIKKGDITIELLPMAHFTVELKIFEEDIGVISKNIGNQLLLKINAYPNLSFSGKLNRIEPIESSIKNNKGTFTALADFSGKNAAITLKSGMNGNIKMLIGRINGFQMLKKWFEHNFKLNIMFY